MEDNLLRPNPIRSPLSLKTSFSGKSSPRNSPRRLGSTRTRRDSRDSGLSLIWVRNNRVVFWLLLITLWAYIGFHVQSQWAHGEHSKEEFPGSTSKKTDDSAVANGANSTTVVSNERILSEGKKDLDLDEMKKEKQAGSGQNTSRKKGRRSRRSSRKQKENMEDNENTMEDLNIPKRNTSYGLIVGPFGKTEDSVLEWSPEKRRGTCNRKGDFSRLVWSRRFVLVFHELSMTGAPLSMLELASEILSCGGSVSAVILSRKGGLMGELERRGVKVLQDRDKPSFKVATKADLVIAGSAVCSSWIEPYMDSNPAAAGQIVWWIMENRREYFDRSKHLLTRVKMVAFLSESQSKQWLSWSEEEKIKFYINPMIVPLSVNDELAFVAGISCSLNTPSASVEKMIEKRELLRSVVRKEMGLSDSDVLVMSLSSINPAKGQKLLLEAALLVTEHNVTIKDLKKYELIEVQKPIEVNQTQSIMNTSQIVNETEKATGNVAKVNLKKKKRRKGHAKRVWKEPKLRKLLSVKVTSGAEENLKVLIGSVGSKSNKLLYVKEILKFMSEHSNLTKSVLWTPATTRVAALYAAADIYVINAQGIGETFGRVTIEAMAFGLPVLGTDAGGTKEIVDHRITGFLHPIGHEGIEILAQNIQYLLKNPSVRKKMGINGRNKVQDKFMKPSTYESFAKVLFKCMKPK